MGAGNSAIYIRPGDRRAGRAVGFVGGGFPYRKYKEGSHNQTRTPAAWVIPHSKNTAIAIMRSTFRNDGTVFCAAGSSEWLEKER